MDFFHFLWQLSFFYFHNHFHHRLLSLHQEAGPRFISIIPSLRIVITKMSTTDIFDHESDVSKVHEEEEERNAGAQTEEELSVGAQTEELVEEAESDNGSGSQDCLDTEDAEEPEQTYERSHSRLGNRGSDDLVLASRQSRSLSVSSKFSDSSSEGEDDDEEEALSPADNTNDELDLDLANQVVSPPEWLTRRVQRTTDGDIDEDDFPAAPPEWPSIHTSWKQSIPKKKSRFNPNVEIEQLAISIPVSQAGYRVVRERGQFFRRKSVHRRYSQAYLQEKRSRLNNESIAKRQNGAIDLLDPLYTTEEELDSTIKSAFEEAAAKRRENEILKGDNAILEENIIDTVTERDSLLDELDEWKVTFHQMHETYKKQQEAEVRNKEVTAELTSRIDRLAEKLQQLEHEHRDCQSTIEFGAAEKSVLASENENLKTRVETLVSECQQLKEKFETRPVAESEHQTLAESAKMPGQDIEEKLALAQAEIDEMATLAHQRTIRIAELEASQATLTSEQEAATQMLQDFYDDLKADDTTRIAELERANQELKVQKQQSDEQVKVAERNFIQSWKTQQQLEESNRALAAANARNEQTQRSNRHLAAFSGSRLSTVISPTSTSSSPAPTGNYLPIPHRVTVRPVNKGAELERRLAAYDAKVQAQREQAAKAAERDDIVDQYLVQHYGIKVNTSGKQNPWAHVLDGIAEYK